MSIKIRVQFQYMSLRELKRLLIVMCTYCTSMEKWYS